MAHEFASGRRARLAWRGRPRGRPEAPGQAGRAGGSALGVAAVIAATVCWGSGSVLGKAVDAPGLVVSFWRLWMGGLFLLAVLYLTGRRLDWRTVLRCVPGGVFFGVNVAFFFSAIRHTTIANAQIIGSLAPVLVLPFAVRWFGERITRTSIVCAALAIVGVVIVTLSGQPGVGGRSTFGDLLAAASLVSWTAFFLVTKQVRRTTGTLEYLATMTTVAAITVTPVTLLTGQDLGQIQGTGWLWLILLILVPGSSGHGLMTWAHAHVDVSVSSVLTLGEPILATILAAMFLGESVTLLQVAGIAVVIVSLAMLALRAPALTPEPLEASG